MNFTPCLLVRLQSPDGSGASLSGVEGEIVLDIAGLVGEPVDPGPGRLLVRGVDVDTPGCSRWPMVAQNFPSVWAGKGIKPMSSGFHAGLLRRVLELPRSPRCRAHCVAISPLAVRGLDSLPVAGGRVLLDQPLVDDVVQELVHRRRRSAPFAQGSPRCELVGRLGVTGPPRRRRRSTRTAASRPRSWCSTGSRRSSP